MLHFISGKDNQSGEDKRKNNILFSERSVCYSNRLIILVDYKAVCSVIEKRDSLYTNAYCTGTSK
ncbi:Dihydrolipoamide acyltransferase [Giardia duodenalis]|uniref:Dihydrolipoamide acyltransferase n=1 Tax=Giardia intestinalis TaxID=5741 RepID=V6TZB9_GIAIN|nr:Dihydrolipoamide acyltransferase [Giardia intestinalis]